MCIPYLPMYTPRPRYRYPKLLRDLPSSRARLVQFSCVDL